MRRAGKMQLVRIIDPDPAAPRRIEDDRAAARQAEDRRLARLRRLVRDLVITIAAVAGLVAAAVWFGSGPLFLAMLAVNVAGVLYLNIRYRPHKH